MNEIDFSLKVLKDKVNTLMCKSTLREFVSSGEKVEAEVFTLFLCFGILLTEWKQFFICYLR